MKTGFSLVELSIVLVILGLLTGGILAGQNLIRAAELRSVSTEHASLHTAIMSFKDKYFQLPGDFTMATRFWAEKTNCVTDLNPSHTCNGSGDGQIYYPSEAFYFWQHLGLAGLLEGSYTGVRGPGGVYDSVPGLNAMPSKFTNTHWHGYYLGAQAGNSNVIAGEYGNSLWLLNDSGFETFTPEQVWNLDVKMDDGLPQSGKLRAYRYSGCITASTSNPFPDATYRLTNTSIACAVIFPEMVK